MNDEHLDDATIDDYVHARLARDMRAAAEAHLDSCRDCSAIVSVVAGGSVRREDAHAIDPELSLLPKGARVGRHSIVLAIGEGAMGVVYLAHDPELDRRVALKLLRREDAAGAARLQREAQAMAKVAHPNVVAVHDVGRFRDAIFIAMEFVDGPTMRGWLSASRTPREVIAVVAGAGRGLAAAHDAGLVHRDFKPENVLVGSDGRARVTDFGLARVGPALDAKGPASDAAPLETLTRTGALLGTPAYMAPEQWRGEEATAASDQFAFAVVLYEALTSKRPFSGATSAELRASIERGPALADAIPEGTKLRPILSRALSARPEDRFPSMHALVSALEPLLSPPRSTSKSRIALVAGAAVIAIGAIAIALRPTHEDRCAAGAVLAAKTLDDARDQRIRAAFAASGAPWTATELDGTLRELHAYCNQWPGAYRATCEATEVRHEQSPALLDARMHCLKAGLDEANALADRLEHPDRDTLIHAREAVLALPKADACADVAALSAIEPRPTGDRRAALDALDQKLAAAHVAATAGVTSPGAIADARTIAESATQIGYRPAIADARLFLATLLRRSGAFDDAAHELDAALLAAEGSHDDRGAALVWLETLALRGEEGNFKSVLASEGAATAALARLRSPDDLDATLRYEIGVAHTNTGEFGLAKKDLDRSLATRSAYGRRDLDVARTLTALGNLSRARGELDEAKGFHERALAIDTEMLGADHPALARHHHNLGGVLRLQGKLDEAQAEYERALALETRGFGPSHLSVGLTENSLGLVAIAKKDWVAARGHLTRALTILGQHPDRALALANLGLVDAAENKHDRAIAELDEALAIHREQKRDDDTVAAVRAARDQSVAALASAGTKPKAAARTVASSPPAAASVAAPASPSSAPVRPPVQGSYGPAQTFDTERR